MSILSIILNVLIILIAVEHVWFMVLEMFLWTKPLGLKVFGQSPEQARASSVLAANQGLYNGFLAAGLIWGLISPIPDESFHIIVFFMSCILVAGIYGGLTVGRKILIVQALPAATVLLMMAFG